MRKVMSIWFDRLLWYCAKYLLKNSNKKGFFDLVSYRAVKLHIGILYRCLVKYIYMYVVHLHCNIPIMNISDQAILEGEEKLFALTFLTVAPLIHILHVWDMQKSCLLGNFL